MRNRRAFLKSIGPAAAVVLIANKTSAIETDDPCEALAGRLAIEMEKRHGGRWVVSVDHENPSVFGRRFMRDV